MNDPLSHFQMNVCRKLSLLQSTLFLAVQIVDSFYSRTSRERPKEETIRVVTFTAVMVRTTTVTLSSRRS